MASRRRVRPGTPAVLFMMVVNAAVSFLLLSLLFKVFGVNQILPGLAHGHAWAADAEHWEMMGTLIPGAAISLGLLWFWLILTGRTARGLSWGGAIIYGVIVAIMDVPVSGLITGLLHDNALLGLLLGLVIMLLAPTILLCMVLFGALTGAFNGCLAQRWINTRYAGTRG